MKNVLYNEEVTNNLIKVEMDFQQREHRLEMRSQAQVVLLQKQVIARQILVNILMGCLAVSLLVMGGILWNNNRKKRQLMCCWKRR